MTPLQITLLVLQTALAVAQGSGVDPTIIGFIQTAINATIAGIAAVQKAKTGVDPNALQPITPAP